MRIRRTLLLAFLMVGVTPSVLLALLAFDRTRNGLQAEIQQGLTAQAEAVLSDLNRVLYERLQNAATWRRTEVMQDLQVGDVDKRLAEFLHRLATGYGGLYRELAAVDPQGRRVASSDATTIGRAAEAGRAWLTLQLADAPITLDLTGTPDQAGTPGTGLRLRTPIPSAFGSGSLGELHLLIDWHQLDQLLAPAAVGGRELALLDERGRLLAGSPGLLARVPRLRDSLAPVTGGPDPMLQGRATQRQPAGLAGLGWQVLVLVPQSTALAPVRHMAWIFAALLAGVVGLTVLASGWVSRTPAQPILALTGFARRWRLGQARPEPPPPAGRTMQELAELREALLQMARENEQSQQQLARSTALAAVGEMSAVIAHEVRTPLGIVLSSAQIVQREPQLSDEGRELLSYIESETARLGRLVSTMLESTRPHPPDPAPTDMAALIRHAVALLAAQAGRQNVQVSAELGDQPLVVDCDAEQMTQVLLNLILNGLQILAQGGRIVISARRAGPGDDAPLLIDIADDGPGIEPAARERIFEAFYFQREGGIGLGLAVVQKIVSAHGGRVEAGSSPLGGALFRIHLPAKMSVPNP